MVFDETSKVWKDGKFIDWKDATIHLASHVIHYGSSVFEGMRCYRTQSGSAIFRLTDHNRRLFNSAKIYRMTIPYSLEQINDACREILRLNGFEEGYLRPIVYRGYESLGVNPRGCPIEVAILALKLGRYLGAEALEVGIDVKVSSWNRLALNTMPSMSKCGANYANAQLIKMDAVEEGFVEGIALSWNGTLSEGSVENLFLVMKGKLYTPPLSESILPGITRDSVIQIARDMGIEAIEQSLPREMLYIADEVFFTGTAAEITPVRSVDHIPVGQGTQGRLTKEIQDRFFGILSGELEDKHGWLDCL